MVLSRAAHRAVTDSISRGVRHLQRCCAEGRWRGFPTLAGESEVWVTAFIFSHLPASAVDARWRRQITSFLLAARTPEGGWSYGGDVPSDADSTAWCLIALEGAHRFSAPRRRDSKQFLWSHAAEGGGVATYGNSAIITKYLRAPPDSVSGWCVPHPDVTAAAALTTLPAAPDKSRAEQALRWLSGRLPGSGLWEAYWWRGPHYTTALTLRALSRLRLRLPPAHAKLVAHALERERLADGGYGLGASMVADPFTTALALESQCRLAVRASPLGVNAAMDCLLSTQGNDGAWAGDYVMRLPAPDVMDPRLVATWQRDGKGGNSFILDRDGLFATAVACSALACALGRVSRSARPRGHWRTLKESASRPASGVVTLRVQRA